MDNQNTKYIKKYKHSQIKDPNTRELIARIIKRDRQGKKIYKNVMREVNKNPAQWIEEAIEETIDKVRYLIEALNRLKKILKK